MHIADRIRAAWETWLEAESREGPVVIVCEDLHAGDVPSVRLVDAALAALEDRPLFVVALARPEVDLRFVDLWNGSRGAGVFALRGCPLAVVERLVRAALGYASPAFDDRIVGRADGNAFFLEELIRAVAENGDTAALPDTVLGMVQARLDALGPNAKQPPPRGERLRRSLLARRCSTRSSAARALPRAAPTKLDDLARREVDLTRRTSSRIAGEEEFVFRHALVAEASYAGLTDADRALAHRLAAAWLEEKGERDALALAEHHHRAGDAAGARKHFFAAAEQALRGSDFEAAIARAARQPRRVRQARGRGAPRSAARRTAGAVSSPRPPSTPSPPPRC